MTLELHTGMDEINAKVNAASKGDTTPPAPRMNVVGHETSIALEHSVMDANNRLLRIGLNKRGEHIFDYSKPNEIAYYAQDYGDQDMAVGAIITLLRAGKDGLKIGEIAAYKNDVNVSYSLKRRTFTFTAKTAEVAMKMNAIFKEKVGPLLHAEEKNFGATNGQLLDGEAPDQEESTILTDLASFGKEAPKETKAPKSLLSTLATRLEHLGIRLNAAQLELLGTYVRDWSHGSDDGALTQDIFKDHWSDMLALFAPKPRVLPTAPGQKPKPPVDLLPDYGVDAKALINGGFPKATFDNLVTKVGIDLKLETRSRVSNDIGAANRKVLGNVVAKAIIDIFNAGSFDISPKNIINAKEPEKTSEHADLPLLEYLDLTGSMNPIPPQYRTGTEDIQQAQTVRKTIDHAMLEPLVKEVLQAAGGSKKRFVGID